MSVLARSLSNCSVMFLRIVSCMVRASASCEKFADELPACFKAVMIAAKLKGWSDFSEWITMARTMVTMAVDNALTTSGSKLILSLAHIPSVPIKDSQFDR